MKTLRWSQRKIIAQGIKDGKSNAQIAREIGVHRSTVGREIERNAESREAYAALAADTKSWQRKQDAGRQRRLFQFGGIPYLTVLQRHGHFYTYYSKTHICYYSPTNSFLPAPYNPAYIRLHEKVQHSPDSYYERIRILSACNQELTKLTSTLFCFENPDKVLLAMLSKARIPWRTTFIRIGVNESEKISEIFKQPLEQGVRNGLEKEKNIRKSGSFSKISAAVWNTNATNRSLKLRRGKLTGKIKVSGTGPPASGSCRTTPFKKPHVL